MVERNSWTRCGVIITRFVIAGTDRLIVAVMKGIVRTARCESRIWNGIMYFSRLGSSQNDFK
jgi:hypothetical protein